MPKRSFLLPVLAAALWAISVAGAAAGPITLRLEDLTPGAPGPVTDITIVDSSPDDADGTIDAVSYTWIVGNFIVSVTGSLSPANPGSSTPYTMDLFNFLIESTGGGTNFRATLTRTDLPTPVPGAVAGSIEHYANMDATGEVAFTSSIAGTTILDDVAYATTDPSPIVSSFGPVVLVNPDYALVSTLDFKFTSGGSMTANTRVEVAPASATVPEPTTLLLFGPGILGLAMFGRRALKTL